MLGGYKPETDFSRWVFPADSKGEGKAYLFALRKSLFGGGKDMDTREHISRHHSIH